MHAPGRAAGRCIEGPGLIGTSDEARAGEAAGAGDPGGPLRRPRAEPISEPRLKRQEIAMDDKTRTDSKPPPSAGWSRTLQERAPTLRIST